MSDLPATIPPTLAEQIAALRREAAIRADVFPKWVSAGWMKQADADRSRALISAAITTLEELASKTGGIVDIKVGGVKPSRVRS